MKTNIVLSVSLFCGLAASGSVLMADEVPSEAPIGPEAPLVMVFRGPDFPDFRTVQIKSNQVYDYVFEKAPSDWRVQSGVWKMTNRWNCSPGWSWFGGRSEEVAAIWNKRKFSGDFSVQFYFAFKEGMAWDYRWPEKPGDVGFSFCADGLNLGSGYNLILGADGNRHTILMKQGQMVAESAAPEALFSSYTDGNPFRGGLRVPPATSVTVEANIKEEKKEAKPQIAAKTEGKSGTAKATAVAGVGTLPRNYYGQTHWWYAKVNKIGNRIECWLDSKLLFTYDDPQPVNAGQFALWTFNNGIMLSRVQIFYENEMKHSFVKNSATGEPNAIDIVSEPVPEVATVR